MGLKESEPFPSINRNNAIDTCNTPMHHYMSSSSIHMRAKHESTRCLLSSASASASANVPVCPSVQCSRRAYSWMSNPNGTADIYAMDQSIDDTLPSGGAENPVTRPDQTRSDQIRPRRRRRRPTYVYTVRLIGSSSSQARPERRCTSGT
jgi:hypothetical protein